MTTTHMRHSEWLKQFEGVPETPELRSSKLSELDTLFALTEDYPLGDGLLEWAHQKIDEVVTVLAAALAPFESRTSE